MLLHCLTLTLSIALTLRGVGQQCPAVIHQPVHQYFLAFDASETYSDASLRGFNPYRNYTHIGTDFGAMLSGPGASSAILECTAGSVAVDMPEATSGGLWHSLSGLQREAGRTLNFTAVWPADIRPAFQPRITGITATIEGAGSLRLEIKDAASKVLWSHDAEIRQEGRPAFTWPCQPEALTNARTLVWIAGPGSQLGVGGIGLEVTLPPDLPMEDYLVLASWAKLSRCRDDASGFLRDRAHAPAGAFDGVPATAMYALAACGLENAGLLVPGSARRILTETLAAIRDLPRAHGLLPHFVSLRPDGTRGLAPGTEWSTVDTALTFHSLYLAALCLQDQATAAGILTMIREIDWPACRGPGGEIRHGFRGPAGEIPINAAWTDWGGETALILLLEAMAAPPAPGAPMARNGQVFRGCGFIAEIQSLFYPWFDRPEPDAVSGVSWPEARQRILTLQQNYFARGNPGDPVAASGLFGLSAGEARGGRGYVANGIDLPGLSLIHPHYMLMSALTDRDRTRAMTGLQTLITRGFFPPWGLVENIDSSLLDWLPMLGSLNAAFETLSALHFHCAVRNRPDAIYEAARRDPTATQAARRFYPQLP